jgi:hypothetical protein
LQGICYQPTPVIKGLFLMTGLGSISSTEWDQSRCMFGESGIDILSKRRKVRIIAIAQSENSKWGQDLVWVVIMLLEW